MNTRGTEHMAATAEVVEMMEEAEMAAEGAEIVEAEAVKIAARVEVSKRRVARILNPAIIPLAPTIISV